MMCCHLPEAELTALDRLSLDGIVWVLGFWVLALARQFREKCV